MVHPAQRRDDKVTVLRSSPRGRARGCDPNGSLQRGSRKRERSPGCAISYTRAHEGRAEREAKELAREKEKQTAGRSEVECAYSIASFSQLSLYPSSSHSFFPETSPSYPSNEIITFFSLGYKLCSFCYQKVS